MFYGGMWLMINPFIFSFLHSFTIVSPSLSLSVSFEGQIHSVRMMGRSLAGVLPRTVFTTDHATPGGVVPPYPGLFPPAGGLPFQGKKRLAYNIIYTISDLYWLVYQTVG